MKGSIETRVKAVIARYFKLSPANEPKGTAPVGSAHFPSLSAAVSDRDEF